LVVHRQRQIVRKVLGRFLRALFQPRVDRKRHLRHFVDGCRHRGRFLEAIPGTERLQLIGIDRIYDSVKEFAELRVAFQVVAALQHPVHGFIKVLARRVQVPGLVVLLPRSEFLFHSGDQILLGAAQGGRQHHQ